MKMLMTRGALTGLGVLFGLGQALASGFMIRENSAAGIATVYAGNGSRADGPQTAFDNPAGMTQLTGHEVTFGTAAILPSVKFSGRASVFGTSIPGNDGGNAGRVAAVPSIFWVFTITDRLKGGISVTVPFGNASEYNADWAGRYLGIKTSALSADVNPNIAYRLSDALSIGAGVSAQYLKLDASSAIAQFLIFGPGTADALYRFKADDWAFGFNLGALLNVGEATRIGATYRSGIDHRIKGRLDFTDANPLLGLVSGSASAEVHLPASVGVSVTTGVNPNLSLSGDVQFTQWSVFKQVVIQSQNPPFLNYQGYRDSWMISVGGTYRLNDRWALRGGLGWDQTPVTDRYRTVSLPDKDRYMVGVGFGYRVTDTVSLDGAYQHSFAFSRATMNQSLNNTDPITHAVVLSGSYEIDVNILATSLRYQY
jgi:long-chain fatty acid transport protein